MSKTVKGTPKSTKGRTGSPSFSEIAPKNSDHMIFTPKKGYPSSEFKGRVFAKLRTGYAFSKADPLAQDREHMIHRVEKWAGSREKAESWYYSEPLPSFGDRTAESLVKDGKAEAVRDYLDSIALGGYE